MEDFFRESGVKWLWEKIKTLLSAKQDKLVSGSNIKTINGTSILGSGDVVVSGDSTGDVDEGRLVWSDNYAPAGTLLDNIMKISGNNVLAFMPPSAITIEYSTDNGVTWLDYEVSDANKTIFVTPELGAYRLRLGKDLGSAPLINDRLRITFDFIVGGIRFTPSKVVVKLEGLGNNDAFHTRISTEMYANYNQDVWEDVADQRNTIPDWGTYKLTGSDWGFASPKYRARLRCEFYRTATSVNRTDITNMILMATKITNANSYVKNHHLYTFDFQQNATFPAAITATKHITQGGTANQVVLGNGNVAEIDELGVGMALESEHAIEADYAETAEKLANARTISLSGSVVGSTTFDGSKNINIPVSNIPQGYIQWQGKNTTNGISPLEAVAPLFSVNRFTLINPNCITVEYSQDGGNTWINYPTANDLQKTYLFTAEMPNPSFTLGYKSSGGASTTLDMLRVKIDGEIMNRYFRINTFLINVGNVAHPTDLVTCTITRTTWGGSTTVSNDYPVAGWPGWNSINLENGIPFGNSNQTNVIKELIFTFKQGKDLSKTPAINRITCIANTSYTINDCSLAKIGHLYTFDKDQNATFPANITAAKHVTSGGTNQQVVLGDGSLIPLSELSPITDADAEILLDNHIHSINVNANGNDVNISIIESSKNGDTWETEDNDIPIPLATTTSAGVMSKEDKIKSDGLLIYYHLTEDEYNNHEIVSLYPLVLAIKDALFDSSTNKWKYDDSKTYDVRVKGWTLQDNGINYLNVNVRLLTSQGGHSIGFSGFVDVDFITETYFDALIPLYIGYICGKYHIENDGMTIVAPEDSGFYVEI